MNTCPTCGGETTLPGLNCLPCQEDALAGMTECPECGTEDYGTICDECGVEKQPSVNATGKDDG